MTCFFAAEEADAAPVAAPVLSAQTEKPPAVWIPRVQELARLELQDFEPRRRLENRLLPKMARVSAAENYRLAWRDGLLRPPNQAAQVQATSEPPATERPDREAERVAEERWRAEQEQRRRDRAQHKPDRREALARRMLQIHRNTGRLLDFSIEWEAAHGTLTATEVPPVRARAAQLLQEANADQT